MNDKVLTVYLAVSLPRNVASKLLVLQVCHWDGIQRSLATLPSLFLDHHLYLICVFKMTNLNFSQTPDDLQPKSTSVINILRGE